MPAWVSLTGIRGGNRQAPVNLLSDATSMTVFESAQKVHGRPAELGWADKVQCDFSLRSDHLLQSILNKLPNASGTSDAERQTLTIKIFRELKPKSELLIARDQIAAN